MEDVYKTLPIALAAFFGAGALMFTAAKATPEETQRVKAWVVQILLLLWLCVAGSWSAYHCIRFATADAPINRPEVALFGMHLINAALYLAVFIFELKKKARERRKAEIKALTDKGTKLAGELLEAKIRADVAEQLATFAQRLTGSPVGEEEVGK
jgi:hypothetical protein